MGRRLATFLCLSAVALVTTWSLAAGAGAYVQYAPCTASDGKHQAGVIFHVRKHFVRWVQLKMSGGKRSAENHARYGQAVYDRNGDPGFDEPGANQLTLVDWPFPNDGRWHTRKYSALEDGSPSTQRVFPEPWGWQKHWSGEWLWYQPWLVFEWADGNICEADSLPGHPPG
jgi:hypothetical protein